MVDIAAAASNIDPATLCSGIVAEHFLGQRRNAGEHTNIPDPSEKETTTRSSQTMFDVRKHFPKRPTLSVQLAQELVDAALRIPGTGVLPWNRGIRFEPNFVHIQYLQKRQPGGIGVSFYGKPESHRCAALRPGRNPNYSWTVVRTREEMSRVLPEVRRAYELKF
jgi:hypothetical protein